MSEREFESMAEAWRICQRERAKRQILINELINVVERMENIPAGEDWDHEQTGYQEASQKWAEELREVMEDFECQET